MNEEIRRAILAMMEGKIPTNSTWAKVKSVTGQTCTILDDDLEIEGILLGFDQSGVIVYPQVNSDVLVMFIDNTKTNGAVVYVENTDKIEIKGNTLGGLVKITPLKTELNKLSANIQTLKTATAAAVSAFSAILDGGATATAFNAAVTSLPAVDVSQLENTKVKHGG